MSESKEAEFHGVFYTRLLDYIREQKTDFEDPVSEQTTESGFADIYLPNPLKGDVVIEIKRDDIYPREHEVIKQARNYAAELDTEFFATCNSNDLFLFHYQGEYAIDDIEFYYFDLRDTPLVEVIPEFLDVVLYVHERDELPTQLERDRIVGILRSFHSSVWPTYKALAVEKYGQNEPFTQGFDDWVQTNDHVSLSDDEQFEIAAKQYAYLLTNKVLFYEIVREKTRAQYDPDVGQTVTPIKTESGFPLDPLADYTTIDNLQSHLQQQFQTVIDEIDYRPIFEENSDLFPVFPQNTKTKRMLDDFVTNIESESITRLDEDLLGEIYEELIPADERKALGQFYTHPKIAETICKWAIQNPEGDRLPRVLDPASGSGTFVVEAYKELEARYAETATHQTIIDSITAIDINRFPLHLTALNLSSQHIQDETDHLQIYHESFFNIDPETDRLVDTRIDTARGNSGEIGRFDAVVGNPPYIRQEDLYPNKEHFRTHLAAFGQFGSTSYKDGSKSLSKRSDAYVYFATHATQFLRDGGRLGFIIPTKWLMTRYGESFQEFLYDHHKVEAIVGFSARAFEDALVDTALLLVERCESEADRRASTTNFVRIKEPMEADDIIDTLDFDYEIPSNSYMAVRNRPAYRTVAVKQDYLMDVGGQKLSPYLQAPAEFIRLMEHPLFTELGELGNTHRGVMTGANDFFFLDEEDLETWNLPERFLTPAIKSIRDADDQVIHTGDSERYLFDIHTYVTTIEQDTNGIATESDLETRVKNALHRDGYDETQQYIQWGESEGYHERRSCATRPVWFDLGEFEPPEILHPKFFNERVFVIWNPDRLMPSNAVDCVTLDRAVDEEAMMGILNSTVNKAMLECWGRAEGGGALQLMTYEVTSLPVLDVREIELSTRKQIARLNDRLIAGEEGAQDALDQAVLDTLGEEMSVDKLQELQEGMMKRRVTSGEEIEVLVERMEELETQELQTFQRDPESSTDLSDFTV